MKKLVHNVETGDVAEVDMTAEEVAQVEADRNIAKQEKAGSDAKASAKEVLLSKLGITADEAALLLG